MKQRYCFYHTDPDRMQYFTILQHIVHSFNIQDDQSTRGLFKPLKNFQNHIRPAGSHFCSANCSECLNEQLSYNIIKKLLCLFSFIKLFYRCVIFKSAGLIPAALWVLLQAMFTMNDWKQTARRLKLQERLPTINKRNIIRWNIYRDNIFHWRRQVLKCL